MTTSGIRRLALALASLTFLALPGAFAQVPERVYGQSNGLCDPDNVNNCIRPNADGSLPISGTITTSLGGFAPAGTYASLAAGTASGNVALPGGATVVVYNTGGVDAYVVLGTSSAVAATTGSDVVKAGAAIALAPGSNTYLAAITGSGSTTLTLSGGTGLYSGVNGGGAATIADGADVTQGAKADAKSSATDTTAISIMQVLKELSYLGQNPVTRAVTNVGTFAVQAAQSGTWNIGNVSGAISLPTGAATAAKQPALGTAGSASSDVLSVQGIASMTPLKVDGSGVTQPVSGSVGGYDTLVSVSPAVTHGSYTANYAIGGTQTVSIFRTSTQPSGILNSVLLASKGGYNTSITIYGFTHSLSSTCTDDAAFSLSSSDLPYLIPGFPITLTPAALNSTTQTIASQTLNVSVKNADSSLDTDLYFCAVVNSTTEPGSTSDLEFIYGMVQD